MVPEQNLVVERKSRLPGLMRLIEELSVYFHFQVQSLNWMLTQVLLRDPLDFGKRHKMKIQLKFSMLHATKCHFIPRHLTLYGLLLMP